MKSRPQYRHGFVFEHSQVRPVETTMAKRERELTIKAGPYDREAQPGDNYYQHPSRRRVKRAQQEIKAHDALEERRLIVEYLKYEAERWKEGTLEAVANLIAD